MEGRKSEIAGKEEAARKKEAGGRGEMWTEMPSFCRGRVGGGRVKAVEMASSFAEGKGGGGGVKINSGVEQSEGRELSVTYCTNKLVCRQNGLRG